MLFFYYINKNAEKNNMTMQINWFSHFIEIYTKYGTHSPVFFFYFYGRKYFYNTYGSLLFIIANCFCKDVSIDFKMIFSVDLLFWFIRRLKTKIVYLFLNIVLFVCFFQTSFNIKVQMNELIKIPFEIFQVWFQNRRAKFRKQERLAQQKVSNASSDSPIKSEGKSVGNTTPKDIKPGSPNSTVSTTPNSSASSHHSNGDIKPLNG